MNIDDWEPQPPEYGDPVTFPTKRKLRVVNNRIEHYLRLGDFTMAGALLQWEHYTWSEMYQEDRIFEAWWPVSETTLECQ